jgi:hypothetical protein
MASRIRTTELEPTPIGGTHCADLASDCAKRVECRVVERPDAWLKAAYRLLAGEFSSNVLVPLEQYAKCLEDDLNDARPTSLVIVAAFIRDRHRAWIVGVTSGELMLLKSPGCVDSPPGELPFYVYAIGHQTTSSVVRGRGVKGIGRRLWEAAGEEARARAERLGGALRYTVLEAQANSIGFWDRMGYRWPRGVRYWQPPLQFDRNGHYLYREVPETLMVKPLEGVAEGSIGRELLKSIVAAIYENWSLRVWRGELEPEAMARAEQYVMGTVFGRVCELMPREDPLPLDRYPMTPGEDGAAS